MTGPRRRWAMVLLAALAAIVVVVVALRTSDADEAQVVTLPVGVDPVGITVDVVPGGGERIRVTGARAKVETFGGEVWLVPAAAQRRLRWRERRAGGLRASLSFLCVGAGRHVVEGAYGRLWVTNAADGTVTVLDPAAREPTTSAAPVQITVGGVPMDVAGGAGSIWVPVDDGLGRGRLIRIDPGSLRTGALDVPGRPRAVAVSRTTGAVWVASTDATAPRARPGRVIRRDAADVPLTADGRTAPAPPCGDPRQRSASG